MHLLVGSGRTNEQRTRPTWAAPPLVGLAKPEGLRRHGRLQAEHVDGRASSGWKPATPQGDCRTESMKEPRSAAIVQAGARGCCAGSRVLAAECGHAQHGPWHHLPTALSRQGHDRRANLPHQADTVLDQHGTPWAPSRAPRMRVCATYSRAPDQPPRSEAVAAASTMINTVPAAPKAAPNVRPLRTALTCSRVMSSRAIRVSAPISASGVTSVTTNLRTDRPASPHPPCRQQSPGP